MANTDPYPAVGSNYRPNFEPCTPNRSVTLTPEEVAFLSDNIETLPTSLQEKVSRL